MGRARLHDSTTPRGALAVLLSHARMRLSCGQVGGGLYLDWAGPFGVTITLLRTQVTRNTATSVSSNLPVLYAIRYTLYVILYTLYLIQA